MKLIIINNIIQDCFSVATKQLYPSLLNHPLHLFSLIVSDPDIEREREKERESQSLTDWEQHHAAFLFF